MYLQSGGSSGETSRPRLEAPSWDPPVCLGKVSSTQHTAAWAGGSKRPGGGQPSQTPAAAAAALLGSARCPRPSAARSCPPPPRPAPAPARRLTHGPPPPAPGASTSSLPFIWPQNRHPAGPTEARGGERRRRSATLRRRGGDAGIGPPRSALFLLVVPPPALLAGQPACFRPTPATRGRGGGNSPRHPAPHLASAGHYSPGSVGSPSLPCPGPNSSALPLRSKPLLGPRRPRSPAPSSRPQAGEPRCRPPASPSPTRQIWARSGSGRTVKTAARAGQGG